GSDTSGCVSTGGLTLTGSTTITYPGFNGASNSVKYCFATLNIETFFGVSGVLEYPNGIAPPTSGPATSNVVVSILNADGSKWVLSYDNYGNVTNMSLRAGGTISYEW